MSGIVGKRPISSVKRDHVPPVEGAVSFHTTRWRIVMKQREVRRTRSRLPYQRSTRRFMLFATPWLDAKGGWAHENRGQTRLPELR